MRQPKVYLAGPISNAPDHGETWRNDIKEWYPNIEFLDPLDQYNSKADDLEVVYTDKKIDEGGRVSTRSIVEYDKDLISSADAVIVNWPGVKSDGTAMEVFYAHSQMLTTVAVADEPLSIWMYHHTSATVSSFEQAVAYIAGSIGYGDLV